MRYPAVKQRESVPVCDVSVVIPCRNESDYIRIICRRLREQQKAGELFSWEVLFLEGCSDDDTLVILQEETQNLENFHVFVNKKRITPAAFNLGIEMAQGRYICILGAHVEIAPDYLLRCLETIKRTGADNVGGPWIAKGRGYVGKAVALAFQSPFAVGNARSHNSNYEGQLDSVWGGFYHRKVFDKIGYFDEELVRNQDDELNYRLLKSGGVIWQSPSIRYSYICRDSLFLLWKQYFQYGYWKVRVIQKHRFPASIRHLIPAIFVSGIAVLSLISIFSGRVTDLLFLAGPYFVVLLAGTAEVGVRDKSFKYLPVIPIIIGIFHIGYGSGFLKGVLDFTILRKRQKIGSIDHKLSR